MSQIPVALDGESVITPKMIEALLEPGSAGDTQELPAKTADLNAFLDTAFDRFSSGADPRRVVRDVIVELHDLRRRVTPHTWQALLPIGRDHAVLA